MRELVKQSLKKNAVYWVLVALTAGLCFGFALTNPSMGIDDESFYRYTHGSGLLSQGRYFGYYMRYFLDTYEFLPFWRDFLALALMVLGAGFIGTAYERMSGGRFNLGAQTVLVCVALAFPYMANEWIFMTTTVEVGYAYVVTGLGLLAMSRVLERRTAANIAGTLALFLLDSVISENGTLLLLTCGTAALALRAFYGPRDAGWKRSAAEYSAFLLALAATAALSKLFGALLMGAQGVAGSGYLSRYVLYSRSRLVAMVISFVAHFPALVWNRARHDAGMLCYVVLGLVLAAAGVRAAVRRRSALPVLWVLAMVLAPLGLFFVTGNIGLDPRTLINLGMAAGAAMAVIFVEAVDLRWNCVRLQWVAAAAAALLTLNLSRDMNDVFYADGLKYQRDKALMEDVATAVRAVDADFAKPVKFLGLPQGPEYGMDSPVTTSIFVWDRAFNAGLEWSSERIYLFLQAHGYAIRSADGVDAAQAYTQAAAMPAWPQQGYARDCGDYVLVKLGDPVMEHFAQSGDSFAAQNQPGQLPALQGWQFHDDPGAFSAQGLKVLPAQDGAQACVCLLGDGDVYALRALRRDRFDQQSYAHNFTGYVGEGLQVYAMDLRALGVRPGVYRAVLWLHVNGKNALYDLGHSITVDGQP